jgi:hypothetical protein
MSYTPSQAGLESAIERAHWAVHRASAAAYDAGQWELAEDLGLMLIWLSDTGEKQLTRRKRRVPLPGQLTPERANVSLEEPQSCPVPSRRQAA